MNQNIKLPIFILFSDNENKYHFSQMTINRENNFCFVVTNTAVDN